MRKKITSHDMALRPFNVLSLCAGPEGVVLMGKETADLFGWVPPAGYPVTPGSAPVDTSQEAADQVGPQAPKLRERCLQALRQYPEGLTADEVATELRCHILTIRPRMTELKAMGKIRDSGRRRHNLSGRRAAVMVLA